MQIWSLFLFHHVLFLSAIAVDGKADSKFRMEKINFVWSKAAFRLKDAAVSEKLQNDLFTFDNLYFELKQNAANYKSTSKSLDEVDAKLKKMLQRYELEDVIHALQIKYKHEKERLRSTSSDEPKAQFENERVAEFWADIKEDSAFTDEDLQEFRNQLIELNAQSREYHEILHRHKQLDDNHIRAFDEHTNTTTKIKELNLKIEKTFEQLRKRADEIRENPFKNTRVRQLWSKARQSRRLIPNELDVIKTELRHFDWEWEKVEFHADHLDEHEKLMKSMGESGTDEQSIQMKKRQQKMLHKLKKLEAYLEEKLINHSEL